MKGTRFAGAADREVRAASRARRGFEVHRASTAASRRQHRPGVGEAGPRGHRDGDPLERRDSGVGQRRCQGEHRPAEAPPRRCADRRGPGQGVDRGGRHQGWRAGLRRRTAENEIDTTWQAPATNVTCRSCGPRMAPRREHAHVRAARFPPGERVPTLRLQ